ncbi:MAG: hypothetical protein ACAH11_12525 [Sphingomonas sp.]
MKIATLLLAGLALGAPVTASAAGICDQINGTYVTGRTGPFLTSRAFIAFDRLVLTAGVGSGDQVTTTPSQKGADHLIVRFKACQPLTSMTARIELETAAPGSTVFASAGNADVTVFDGGLRIWIRGNIVGGEPPGWLLRVPAPPAGM